MVRGPRDWRLLGDVFCFLPGSEDFSLLAGTLWRLEGSAESAHQDGSDSAARCDPGCVPAKRTQANAITTKHSTLPSGPTVPPLSQSGPRSEELNRWPGESIPLSGTE